MIRKQETRNKKQKQLLGSPSSTFAFARAAFVAPLRIFSAQCRKNTKHGKSGAGFTMIETLIAIAVLMLAVAGPLTLAAQGLISARFAKDQITAFYLAQEAVEVIRNNRDNNALQGEGDWMSGLREECFTEFGCQLDATKYVERCRSEGCDPLDQHTGTGFYKHNINGEQNYTQSKFTRTVKMENVGESNVEARAEITIGWSNGPINQSFTIQENFLDWQ